MHNFISSLHLQFTFLCSSVDGKTADAACQDNPQHRDVFVGVCKRQNYEFSVTLYTLAGNWIDRLNREAVTLCCDYLVG